MKDFALSNLAHVSTNRASDYDACLKHVWGQNIMRLIAPAAVLVAGVCTTAMNWRFSFQLGTNEFDSYTWAVFSVALDVCKWFMLPCAALAWNAHRPRATAAIAIWCVATLYSFTAAIGFAAINRDTNVASRLEQAELHRRLELMRQSPRWNSTAACADATSPQSREFCTTYRATAARIQSAPQEADPQSALFARLTGLKQETVRLILSLFLAIACEIISALGLFALMEPKPIPLKPIRNVWRPPTRPDTNLSDRALARSAAPQHDEPRPAAPKPVATWKNPR